MKIVNSGNEGHRRELIELLQHEFLALGIEPEVVSRIGVFEPGPVLYALIEDSTVRFVVTALLRELYGRKTVGLLFRPGQCFRRYSARHLIKRIVLHVLTGLRSVEVLTILPHDLDARFASVSTGWIYDPQLWDLASLGRTTPALPSAWVDDIRRAAGTRRIIVALGALNAVKGFDYLAKIAASPELARDRVFFVAAGKLSEGSRSAGEMLEIAGGALLNKHVSDSDLLAIYAVADLVWSCYAPDYDQASGIFGRAVQLGIPTVVRSGSYLEKLAQHVGHPVLGIPFGNPRRAAESISAFAFTKREQPLHVTERMRQRSLDVLRSALGLAAPAT